jgi:hypothetical protein
VDAGEDWGDFGIATASGALSGAMIASGNPFGASMGMSMAANQVADHATNSLTGQDFSAAQHLMRGTTGLASGALSPGVGTIIDDVVAGAPSYVSVAANVVAVGAAQGVTNAVGDYALTAAQGQGQWDNGTIGWNIVGSGIGQIGRLHPNSTAWQTFSAVYSESLARGMQLNADIVSSTVYQNTVTSPVLNNVGD